MKTYYSANMKTFGQLFDEYDWSQVWEQLQRLYPVPDEAEPAYQNAFLEVRDTVPAGSDMLLKISLCEEEDLAASDHPYAVSGIENDQSYGIEYSPWATWKGMNIHPETLETYSEIEIIAHGLEEMTFCGFSYRAIEEQQAKFKKIADEINKPFWKTLFKRKYITDKEMFGETLPWWERFFLKLKEIGEEILNILWQLFTRPFEKRGSSRR